MRHRLTTTVALLLAGAGLSAVQHAGVVAHRVREPFGSLVLAVAVWLRSEEAAAKRMDAQLDREALAGGAAGGGERTSSPRARRG